MAKMQFQLDTSEKTTKISLGMYSKEGEYVAFSEPCDCSGQVMETSFLLLLPFFLKCVHSNTVSINLQDSLFDLGPELLSVTRDCQVPLT